MIRDVLTYWRPLSVGMIMYMFVKKYFKMKGSEQTPTWLTSVDIAEVVYDKRFLDFMETFICNAISAVGLYAFPW